MQVKVLLKIIVSTVWLTGLVTAQQRPNFSGTWTATKDSPSTMAAAPSPVFGERFALQHDGERLTITRPVRDMTISVVHVLDGTEVRSRVPGRLCEGDAESIATAAWEGNAVAITAVGSVPPGRGTVTKLNVKRLFRLETPETLVVEGSMRQAGQTAPVPAATVYKRTTESIPAAESRPSVKTSPATIGQVAWIAGGWIGAGTPVTVEERWLPPAGGSMIGIGRSSRSNVMASFEFLCIAERQGSLVYTAMPNGRTPATDFMLTQVSADSATFENPAHDFPKIIQYTKRPDGTLETAISAEANQRRQTFVLKRQE